MHSRFLWMNYDALCANPKSGIRHLTDFLPIQTKANTLKRIYQEIHLPESAGRYRNRPLSVFPANMIKAVQEMGFIVES